MLVHPETALLRLELKDSRGPRAPAIVRVTNIVCILASNGVERPVRQVARPTGGSGFLRRRPESKVRVKERIQNFLAEDDVGGYRPESKVVVRVLESSNEWFLV